MKLVRHHNIVISVALISCVSLAEVSTSQAREYARSYSGSDRQSRSIDNVWRSGTTFHNIRRARYEREGSVDNPWQANNNSRFEQPRSRERSWNNHNDEARTYDRGDRYRNRNSQYRVRSHDYDTARYRDAYTLSNYPYERIGSMSGFDLDPISNSPLIRSSLHPSILYGGYGANPYSYGAYPYPGLGGGGAPW
ncbi:MAG: hypothetical protein OQK73_10725 [Gammaproteobacteria bacterium]|nr:hypothetical protein [Gammaproteobacteria bacterium]